MFRQPFWGFVLVLVGVLYLLHLLHVLPNMFEPGILWPMLLILLGLSGFGRFRGGRVPWWSFYTVLLGLLLLLRNMGLLPLFAGVDPINLFWALVIIGFGLALIGPRWKFGATPSGSRSRGIRQRDRGTSATKWIGDLSVGSHAWVLTDTQLQNWIGDVRINLATAQIEDGTHHLDIEAWIGDITVLVPEGLCISVDARVSIGDVDLFGDKEGGLSRTLSFMEPGFEQAAKRVVIRAVLWIGEIRFVRV